MDIPVLITEQYPKGLGTTVSSLDTKDCRVVPKTQFNMMVPDVEEFVKTVCEGNLKSILLLGVEVRNDN